MFLRLQAFEYFFRPRVIAQDSCRTKSFRDALGRKLCLARFQKELIKSFIRRLGQLPRYIRRRTGKRWGFRPLRPSARSYRYLVVHRVPHQATCSPCSVTSSPSRSSSSVTRRPMTMSMIFSKMKLVTPL